MTMSTARVVRTLAVLAVVWPTAPLVAQQTGAITGKAVDTSGLALPGVTVEARGDTLPAPRVTVTDGTGEYRMPALPPGTYSVTFDLSGMQSVTRQARVQLALTTVVDVTLGVAGLTEVVQVTASTTLVSRETTAITSAVSSDHIMSLPVGQEYRDLVKLIPGVQYTQDLVRGPSAGASGQDNVYKFDGVDVTLPLFGTLSAEPASHDIDQVSTVKGGARAVDFNRAAGFSIDSVSKSGTNRHAGQLGFQLQDNSMTAGLDTASQSQFEQDRAWLTANAGGPLIPDRLFFYGSYYRPTRTRDNRANLYGDLPQYTSRRHEGFGKLTLTPVNSLLVNTSWRESKREDKSDLFAANASATTGTGNEAKLRIITAEGSWVINARSTLTFKYTNFANRTLGLPDFIAAATPATQVGTRIDINGLDTLGRLGVPVPVAGQTAYNQFIQPLIDRYGYVQNGVRVGGGIAGYGAEINDQDFFRNAGQVAYDVTLGTGVRHDLHAGFQVYRDAEDLVRSSNGWGLISVPGGRLAPIAGTGQSAFYTARFQQQTIGAAPKIRSEYLSANVELNDTIRWKHLSVNLGVLLSRDTLFGQGLREDASTLSGYVSAPGNKYEMYKIPFSRMIQPRLGATWAYNGTDTVYVSFARYIPAASSLPRAASWDRNLIGTFIDAHFDANGVLFASVPVGSSSGKLFVEDMTPRRTDEWLVGTAKEIGPQWTARLYARYRKGSHFWEDTNNNARVAFNPPAGIPRDLYIPDLTQRLAQIGSGSTYVIAELDGAYTKYYEATLESEWRGRRAFVRGSYTWSRYRGNFDQDNSTTSNDANVFIGSSFIADGAGRQLWDFRDGILRGDRPHLFKLYGYHTLDWNASAGAYVIAQSGQPWETWSYLPYVALTTSTSDVSRYAERAGSRRSDAHWQLDLNYTQNLRLAPRANVQLALDLYNVVDKQTGYDIQPAFSSSLYGQPRFFYLPRTLQIAMRFQF
jgi:hypothetical protein